MNARTIGGRFVFGFAGLLLLVLIARSITIIPAGHVGVVDLFGRVRQDTQKSGLHLVNPLARVTKMSVKTQELKEIMDVPSKEGLSMQIEVSALFHLDPDRGADVYRTIGPDYVPVILIPQFRSVARGVTAASGSPVLRFTGSSVPQF